MKIEAKRFYGTDIVESPVFEGISEIGDYAFGECRKLKKVSIPAGVERIGRYAFYNCRGLEEIEMNGRVRDIYDGAFKNCENVKKVVLNNVPEDGVWIKDIMNELEQEFSLLLHYKNGKTAALLFPKNSSEVVANEPARNSREIIHGAGGYYRVCAGTGKIDFTRYDELFELALREENDDTIADILSLRLLYPYEMKQQAWERYISCLNDGNDGNRILKSLIVREKREIVRCLYEKKALRPETARNGAMLAGKLENALMAAVFMDISGKERSETKKKFSL